VPRIRLTTWVLDDTDLVDIDPSHLPESRTPNQPGNTALFGHRTSKGREFRNIDRIRLGDPIHLAVQGKIYTYSATNVEVLSPDDPRLYASSSNEQTITLVACHPPGSVKWRIVVFGRLQSVTSF
jgi:sortase A